MVDRDLFLHDLSVVAILKNEGPYLKEWLDYHLLAGVDHFYLYDNDSTDNQAEVAKPYVEAGLVDYIPAPGQVMQHAAYNDAVKRFKFQSRYLAFIDGDEFIFPKKEILGGIVEVVDEILSPNPNAAGLGIHWQCFGSNGHEKADYSRGVLERFTRRAPKDWAPPEGQGNGAGNIIIKTITNPRKINVIYNPHFAVYFEGHYSINECNKLVFQSTSKPIVAEKIVVNHYQIKSQEEYNSKLQRGAADGNTYEYMNSKLALYDRNEEFDDGILKYRAERAKIYRPPDKSHADERLFAALMKNLSPTLLPNTPPNFYAGKMETFLTCRAVAAYLKTKIADDAPAKFFEEASLKAILKSVNGMTFADARLLIRELPNLLTLPYPVVKDLRNFSLQLIPQMMNTMRMNGIWKDYVELDFIRDLIKIGG